ncbi:hypothetical protein ACROYT_G027002 [Oculina patagonica]
MSQLLSSDKSSFSFSSNFRGGHLNDEELDLDGYDVWRAISNGEGSPRTEILHNIDTKTVPESELGFAYQGIGLRVGDMKLLMGVPNISYFIPPEDRRSSQASKLSRRDLEDPPVPIVDVALYNITADPYEKNDLSQRFPDIVKKLQDRVQFYMKGAVPSGEKPPDAEARKVAKKNGAWSPWK